MSNYPENWETDVSSRTILPEDYLVKKPTIGATYHVSWARSKGMHWKLISFNDTIAYLRTPSTRKSLTCKLSDLRETASRARKNAYFREHKK